MQICPNVAAACMARFATPPPMAAQRPAPLGPFTPWERFSCTIPQQRETAMATSAERMWALRERAILQDNSEAHTGFLTSP
jgi:hypothetical protein